MKRSSFRVIAARICAIAVIAVSAGCTTTGGSRAGTADIDLSGGVRGRDLGRGGATSGGVSSLDQGGNAADYSGYEEAMAGD